MILESKSLKSSTSQFSLTLFLFVGLVPFALAVGYAVLYSVGVIGIVNEGFTLLFWQRVWESGEFVRSFGYSAGISAIAVLISVSLALMVTLTFRKSFEGKLMSYMIYLPLAVPGMVAAFLALQLFSKAGFFSRVAFQFGWIASVGEFPDLVNDRWGIGMIFTFITVVLPFFVLLFLNVYKNERIAELSQLAHSLGATSRQILWKVSLPLLLQKTWTLIVLYFVFILGAYEIPLVLGQESPQMLSVMIIRELKQFDLTKISQGYVVAVIYTLIVSLAAIVLFSRTKTAGHGH